MTDFEAVDILIVEDNASQKVTILEALRTSLPDICAVAVNNGTAALDFLLARKEWIVRVDEEPPRLILLDLGLPDCDHVSVLGKIRSLDEGDALALTPIVVFTDSQSAADISKCYRGYANSYIIKPLSFPDFQSVVMSVGRYWLTLNRSAA